MSHAPCPIYTDGEASNPGPVPPRSGIDHVVAASTNMTSMKTQLESVLAIPADILGGQEVRLCEAGQVDMSRELHERGWSAVFGKALSRKPGSNRVPPGGVAILARKGMRMQHVPPQCIDGHWLWNTTRFVHAVVEVSTGIVHVISVYGHTNAWTNVAQRVRNEELLTHLVKYIAALGDVPLLLLGDFNTPPEFSAILSNEIGSGSLVDLAATTALAAGVEAPPTCHAHPTSPGSRIDLAFANSILAGACSSCELFESSALPVHKPVLVTLNTSTVAQQGPCFRTPLAFPMNFQDPNQEAEKHQSSTCAQACVDAHWANLSQALQSQDVEQAFEAFNQASEQYYCTRAFGQTKVKPDCGLFFHAHHRQLFPHLPRRGAS